MINNKKYFLLFTTISILTIVIINSCKKEEPLPPNPYDSINYGSPSVNTPPDPNSIVGIHTNILKTSCAKAGCHDGNFEPDFRTVQSSYATLVWHGIKKNSADTAFTYRVVPFDTSSSVLYERITNCCFVNQDDRMPQDNIGIPLPASQIKNIANWIMAGAKDMFGNPAPNLPNTEPTILYYLATNSTYTANYGDAINRIDSVFYNPFFVPNNSTLNLLFFVKEDSTTVPNMHVNLLKISTKANDFSSAISIPTTYLNFPPNEFYLASINTGTLPNSDTLFMRYYTNDGDHAINTQFPTDNLILPYKTYWSFIVKP